MVNSATQLMIQPSVKGFSPDWVGYTDGQGFQPDQKTLGQGSYDAIRVYLWAGMLSPDDPVQARLLTAFSPLVNYIKEHGFPPERLDSVTGDVVSDMGPAGFSWAVIPFLRATGNEVLVREQIDRAKAVSKITTQGYYGRVLALFGAGWVDGRYAFAPDGLLRLP
jgi:endoglucanase